MNYMLFLLCGGITVFSVSFTLSYSITRDILRYRLERLFLKQKSPPKVTFEQIVSVKHIPNRKAISSDTLNKLWYSDIDYEYFKYCYMHNYGKKHYNSI